MGAEKLTEDHGCSVSGETLRGWMIVDGLGQDRRHRLRSPPAAAELIALQADYRTWLNALPQNLEESTTAEAMRTICDLDLSYIESVERGAALVATDAKIADRLPGSSSSRAR